MKKTAIAGMLIASLGGCATLQEIRGGGNEVYYVSPEITGAEINKIAADLAALLSRQLPPAKTTLAFKPELTLFHEVLLEELAGRGYGIATGEIPPEAVSIRYYVTILDRGILARVNYKDQAASRYYRRTERGLSSGGVLALRGGAK